MKRVLASNDALAASQLAELDRHGVLSLNLMSGPGAGKTSLVERTVERLRDRLRIYVIEGDIQGSLDAERVAAAGAGVTQINTQGACHLDGMMLQSALPDIDLATTDLLIIENVGNLVCPAEFKLPAHFNVTLVSTPEGSDKPAKYPLMFERSDLVIISKTDLLPHVDFDVAAVERAVAKLKPGTPVLKLSCRTGEGLEGWFGWLEERLGGRRGARAGE
jgi:hydrogenase nickel incorporation protein HypB